MADPRDRLFARPDAPHTVHDLLLVASWAGGDATGDDRTLAEQLVAACPDCRNLADDIRAIQQATAAAPAVRRPRDFRLTPHDAERLRPHGVRRFVAAVAHPRLERAHPMAAGLTMLGLTGLLVSGIAFGGQRLASTADQAAPEASRDAELFRVESGAGLAESNGPDAGGAGAQPAATDRSTDATPAPAAPAASAETDIRSAPAAPAANSGQGSLAWPLVAAGSLLLTIAGLVLFVVARRQRLRTP